MSEKRACRRCHAAVTKSEVDGYSWYCPKHDEDLYEFETETVNMPRTDIRIRLIDEDGNIFAVLGRVRQALRHGGRPDLVQEVTAAVFSSHSYEEALAKIMEYVEVE